jgi:hypothetical protein
MFRGAILIEDASVGSMPMGFTPSDFVPHISGIPGLTTAEAEASLDRTRSENVRALEAIQSARRRESRSSRSQADGFGGCPDDHPQSPRATATNLIGRTGDEPI